MKQPDGFDGYMGGFPYWILPSGQKHMIMKNDAELITNTGKV